MIIDQKKKRKETAKVIIFNMMNDSGLTIEDLARDELDLTPSKSDRDSRE
jgi:hypothetical protein